MRPRVVCGIAAAVALFATACGSGAGNGNGNGNGNGAAAADTAKAAPASGFPVKVADCAGKETTVTKAPTKIVTSNAASL
ncbi:hypothetical protein VM95_38020, partial [Streptomyces rubellomurinus]